MKVCFGRPFFMAEDGTSPLRAFIQWLTIWILNNVHKTQDAFLSQHEEHEDLSGVKRISFVNFVFFVVNKQSNYYLWLLRPFQTERTVHWRRF